MPLQQPRYDQLIELLPHGPGVILLMVTGWRASDLRGELERGETSVDPDSSPAEWAIAQVGIGAVAVETTGGHDLDPAALEELSKGGRVAALVRENFAGALRFGYAEDGRSLFDEEDFAYLDDLAAVPDEIRPVLETVWDRRAEDSDGDPLSQFAAAIEMAEIVTDMTIPMEALHEHASSPGDVPSESGAVGAGAPTAPSPEYDDVWSLKPRKGVWRLVMPSYPTVIAPHPAVALVDSGIRLTQPGGGEWDFIISSTPSPAHSSIWRTLATWSTGPGQVRLVDAEGRDAPRAPAPILDAQRFRVSVAARADTDDERVMRLQGDHTAHDLMIYIHVYD